MKKWIFTGIIIAVAITSIYIFCSFDKASETASAATISANQAYCIRGVHGYPYNGFPSSTSQNASGTSSFTNLIITFETNSSGHQTFEVSTLYWYRWYFSSTNKQVVYTLYDGGQESTSNNYLKFRWYWNGSNNQSFTYGYRDSNGTWQESLLQAQYDIRLKFSSSDFSLNNQSNNGTLFKQELENITANAFSVVNQCTNLDLIYPTMVSPPPSSGTRDTIIYIDAQTGYSLPAGNDYNDYIQFQYTALDFVYYPEYGELHVQNLNSDLIITGSLPPDITVYNITWNITNGTGSPSIITEGTTTTLTITPNNGFTLPVSITYSGTASDVQYYNDTGDIVITYPTSDFTITAICDPTAYLLKAGYYIPDIRAMETVRALERIYIGIEVPHYLSKGLGEIVTAQPEDSYYRYNIIDTNFSDGDVYRGGILFDCREQYLGIWATDTVNDNEAQRQEHIVSYDALNTSFNYTNLYLMYVPNNTNIPYYARDFFIDMGNYITFYALPTSIYTIGVTDGENTSIIGGTSTSVISQIFSALFGQIFAVEIFPGFPLYIFILIPVVFGIIGLLLWLIRGK